MTSFAIKGWLLGSARISGTFSKMSRCYPGCAITTILNGKEQTFDGTKVMKWISIFNEMEENPLSILQVRLDGKGEKELSAQMVSFLWSWNIADNMYMIILPNKTLETALMDNSALFVDDDYSQYCLKVFSKFN